MQICFVILYLRRFPFKLQPTKSRNLEAWPLTLYKPSQATDHLRVCLPDTREGCGEIVCLSCYLPGAMPTVEQPLMSFPSKIPHKVNAIVSIYFANEKVKVCPPEVAFNGSHLYEL